MRSLLPVFVLFVACLASAQNLLVARVTALASGKILLNGKETTIYSLSSEFEHLKAKGGEVWYYRENAQSEPHPQAMEVIKLVVRNNLPISMSSKPDFSDYVDGNGYSYPRKP